MITPASHAVHWTRSRPLLRRHDGAAAHRNREHRVAMAMLLRRCRALLAQWDRLHCLSVKIGQAEHAGLAESELFADPIAEVRGLVEQADRLCAEITRLEQP